VTGTLTRVPAAIAKVVEIATAVAPGGFQVQDGPQVGVELPDRVLVVGMPYGSRPGYSSSIRRQDGYGRPRLAETFTIRCLVSFVQAGDDLAAVRDACHDVLAALDAALRDDAVVEGVWDRADISGDFEWMPMRAGGNGAPAGVVCHVLFEIVGTALL